MITFSRACDLRSRATASARPTPIAVRVPSRTPIRNPPITASRIARSVVSGQSVMAPFANMTTPIRSACGARAARAPPRGSGGAGKRARRSASSPPSHAGSRAPARGPPGGARNGGRPRAGLERPGGHGRLGRLRLHHELAHLLDGLLALLDRRHPLRVLDEVRSGEEPGELVPHGQPARAHAGQDLGGGLLDRGELEPALEIALQDL